MIDLPCTSPRRVQVLQPAGRRSPAQSRRRPGGLWLGALMLVGPILGCGAGPKPPEEDEGPTIVALHTGTYTCGEVPWAAKLQVATLPDGDVLGTVTLAAKVPPERVVVWGVKGQVTPAGDLSLRHSHDIDVPLGFRTHGFQGKVDLAGFDGATTEPGCGPVKLQRFDKAPGSPLGG